MQRQSDAELLCRYARQGSEAAFGEIVARHADLVYSAALRQVDSSDVARDALLLRFFKNQGFRAVGVGLGISDDAAQKRVSRAVEKLRGLLARRGITTTAAALSAAISANAIQTAPGGLVASILAAATSPTAVAPAAVAAIRIIAMTTMQKTLVVATLAAAIGTGMHEARRASGLSDQLRSLQQQQMALAEQVAQLTGERDDALGKIATFREESQRLRSRPQLSAQPGADDSGDPFQLQPYVTNPTQQAALQRIIEIINQPHK